MVQLSGAGHPSEDILLGVICVTIAARTDNLRNVACTISPIYYPPDFFGLSGNLVPALAIGDSSFVAQTLFDDFVQGSSDEILEEHRESMTHVTKHFWTEGYAAGYKMAGDECQAKSPATAPPKKD